MKRAFFISTFFLFSISAARADVAQCPEWVENPLTTRAGATVATVADQRVSACKRLAASPRCKEAYGRIEAGGHDSEEYKRTCSSAELKSNDENFFLSGQKIYGCAIGVGDAVIGDFARSLGEGAAKIVTDFQIDSYCNKHLDYKKMLYLSHNATMPPDLQVKIPPDNILNAYSCSDLRGNIYEENRYLWVKKQRTAPAKPSTSSDGLGLVTLSKRKLKELGIDVECYNPKKAVELICSTTSYVAMAAAIPISAVYKLKTAAGLASELSKAAEITRVGEAESAAVETAKTAANVSKSQAAPNASVRSAIADWSKKFFTPVEVPKEVRVESVIKKTEADLDYLDRLGVEGHVTKDPTYLRTNVETFKKTKLTTKAGEAKNYGVVFEVDRLPPAGSATGPGANAFRHPLMAEYKKKLEAMGYRLVVDTSIDYTGAGAYHWSHNHVIALRPNSSWQTFLHEFQHAEFAHYLERNFYSMQINVMDLGKPLATVLKPETLQALGTERVQRLETLIKKGLPELAVNETLSVDAELKVMGFRRYVPILGSGTEKYALRHQINELTDVAARRALQPIEAKTMNEAKLRYAKLIAYDSAGVAVGFVGASVGEYAAIRAVLNDARAPDLTGSHDPNSYAQIIYNEKGDTLAQKPDGTWVTLSRK